MVKNNIFGKLSTTEIQNWALPETAKSYRLSQYYSTQLDHLELNLLMNLSRL